ncbi:hypothetical protein [Rufibacter immobilis]|uniref:hypothetical protein n=1 Tax=Rufibacter immobilis TaxID=1348778 RepID=UPI0035E6C8AE
MKKHRLFLGLAFVFGSLGLSSCYDEPEFDLAPTLTFRDIEQRTLRNPQNVIYDSLILVVRFQDGDGDLGLSETIFPQDIQPPFSSRDPYFNNIFCNIYKKVNGQYERVLYPGTTPLVFHSRFPRVSTIERQEPLEGDIRYSLNIFDNPRDSFYPLRAGDTIRFDVKILDRSHNESPTVTTSEVILFSKQ